MLSIENTDTELTRAQCAPGKEGSIATYYVARLHPNRGYGWHCWINSFIFDLQDDFKKHDNVQRAEPIRPRPDNNNNEKNQAFHGNTTYRDIYTEKNPEPTRGMSS